MWRNCMSAMQDETKNHDSVILSELISVPTSGHGESAVVSPGVVDRCCWQPFATSLHGRAFAFNAEAGMLLVEAAAASAVFPLLFRFFFLCFFIFFRDASASSSSCYITCQANCIMNNRAKHGLAEILWLTWVPARRVFFWLPQSGHVLALVHYVKSELSVVVIKQIVENIFCGESFLAVNINHTSELLVPKSWRLATRVRPSAQAIHILCVRQPVDQM